MVKKNYDDMLTRFHTILACYAWTDGRTDRIAISISRVSVLTRDKKGKGSWICIAPHCEKLASEALTHGSHSFYAAITPHLPLPRIEHSPDGATTDSDNSSLIAASYSFIDPERMKG